MERDGIRKKIARQGNAAGRLTGKGDRCLDLLVVEREFFFGFGAGSGIGFLRAG